MPFKKEKTMIGPDILVLDGDHPNALSVVQSLGRAGYRVSLAGANLSGPAFLSRYPVNKMEYPDPFRKKSAFIEWVARSPEEGRSGTLFPVTDKTIHPLMEMKTLGILPLSAFLPDSASFSKIFDKQETMTLAHECGIPIPRTVVLFSPDDMHLAEGFSYPCFAKPASSKVWNGDTGHNLSAEMIRNRSGLEEAVTRLTKICPVLLQEYVPGEGVGIEVLCDKGEVVLEFAHKRVHELPLTGGGSSYRVSIESPGPLRDASRKLLGRIGWHGLAMVEFKVEGDRFWLMEVNGRVWGSMPLALSAGADFPRFYADLDLRFQRPRLSIPPRIGLYQRKLYGDIVWFRDNLKADKTDKRLHTRPVLRTALEWLRFLWGQDRWDSFRLSDPAPFVYELKGLRDTLTRKLSSRIDFRKERSRSRAFLEKKRPRRILVLCYGNICRSPYAERFLQDSLQTFPFEIRSAGFYPETGRTSPESFKEVVATRGINLDTHQSSLTDAGLMEWADIILIMDRINWKQVQGLGKKYLSKTAWLGAWGPDESPVEIDDPYGKPSEKMQAILDDLDQACLGFSRSWKRPYVNAGRVASDNQHAETFVE
ncbi:MAG: arsenate reductase/protein-tyrosine-phosphatase family protein [Leptospirales bacterium]